MRDVPHSLQNRRIERLLRRIEELRAWRNARETTIPEWRFTSPDGTSTNLTLGDFWPVVDLPVTLTATGTIPAGWAGAPVELELWLGGEAFVRLSTGLQAGLNPMHHRFPVTESAIGGESITIEAEVVPKGIFGGRFEEPRIERAHLVIPHRDIRALERDLTMLREACIQLDDHEVVPFLLDAAEHALSELADGWPSDADTAVSRYVLGYESGLGSGVEAVPFDWRDQAIDAARPTNPTWSLPPAPRALEPMPESGIAAVVRARDVLATELETIRTTYPPVGSLCLTGHAHIDLAWLWPLAETRRKIRRTFSTVLNLMDQYPDFTFNQSSAQAYAWIEEDDPALFARIKDRVAEGRWEPTGGMWLEPDCMVTGGEALVRQILYGQRYFEQAFGKRHTNAWLPDVFGFSGGMPQILAQGGLPGFFTIKLNWNEVNRLPHDLFRWEGVDGSAVTAHLFFNPGHGYNGNIVPLDILGTWRNYRDKTVYPESILAFGWGDGAGGPSEKMLENYARLKDFPAFPKLRMGRADDYFANAPDRDSLPTWSGELYLELHRGTLTSQSRTKKLNRDAEQRLLEAETMDAIAVWRGYGSHAERLESAWKTVLLNQFHDILPGSSINEVYTESVAQMTEVLRTAQFVLDVTIAHLGRAGRTSLLIFNTGLNPRPLRLWVNPGFTDRLPENGAVIQQPIEVGTLVARPGHIVPGLGWVDLGSGLNGKQASIDPVTVTEESGAVILQNALIRVEIGGSGQLVDVYDRQAERAVLTAPGNVLTAYVDKPRAWDAWDVDETYERDAEVLSAPVSIRITEHGPLRASVEVVHAWRSSRIVQIYRLWYDSKRIDIETTIDWQEKQVLLRAAFPLAVHSHEATFETMYGAVRRPTHRNTSWDQAKFEAAAHRWADLSESGYGVALLNNGRYGHAARGNSLSLSLVRSPLYPDVLADLGEHEFTYSLFPHIGDWSTGGVVREAFDLNSPLIYWEGRENAWLARSEGIELQLGALKKAQDSDDLIMRVHEPNGARGMAQLVFAQPVASVTRVNLLEDDREPAGLRLSDDRTLITFPIHPFEIVSLKLTF